MGNADILRTEDEEALKATKRKHPEEKILEDNSEEANEELD